MTHCFTCAGQSAYWHLQRRRGRTHIASAFAMLSLRALHPPTHYSSLRTRLCVYFAARRGGCSSALFRTCVRGSSSTRSRRRCRMRCRHDVGATEGCAALHASRVTTVSTESACVCLFVCVQVLVSQDYTVSTDAPLHALQQLVEGLCRDRSCKKFNVLRKGFAAKTGLVRLLSVV